MARLNERSVLATTALRKSGLPSVSRSLQVLALVVLVLIVGATAQQLLQIRAAILAETERQMARLDMVFAEQTGRAVETIDFIVNTTIALVEQQRANPPVDDALILRQMNRSIQGVRQVSALAITDAAGHVRYAAPATVPADLPPTGRALLDKLAHNSETGLVISEPFRETDGAWNALLIRPMREPGGKLIGAGVAWINLAYFEDFYKAVELTENGAIILHLRNGVVLARYPHAERAIGTSFADLPPFKDILSHAMFGTVLMDSPIDGSIRVLSIRALRAFPLAVQVSVDESKVLTGWRRQAWIFTMLALVASGVIVTQLLLLAQRSRDVEVLAGEFRTAKETAEQANAALRDQMAERERAEAALRQAQRIEAVGQLTGGVAHDFNNLLTVLLGNIELIEAAGTTDSRLTTRVAAMRGAAERGARLTAQLLAFARQQPLVPRPVDLNAVVTGMEGLMQSALGRTVRIAKRLDPALWPALVDPTQIELVILNLASNARDAMPGGGELAIETRNVTLPPPHADGLAPHADGLAAPRADGLAAPGADALPAGDYVTIRVSDTGVGMTPEVLAKAFEPFFTTKQVGAGSGLGLSQVFGTARQSGGDVTIASEPGRGTAVTLYLPRAPAAVLPAPLPAASRSSQPAERRLLLLVDDDDAVRATTADMLRQMGFGVIESDGGRAALERLRQEPGIAVLLTDVVMPDMNGPVLAAAAAALRPGLPVVFLSGYSDLAGVTGGAPLGRLVSKPYRPAELMEQIGAALSEMPAEAG
jgi:signal transduction histidine kinase/ActR/RegA family two-component response regulator